MGTFTKVMLGLVGLGAVAAGAYYFMKPEEEFGEHDVRPDGNTPFNTAVEEAEVVDQETAVTEESVIEETKVTEEPNEDKK